MAPDRSPSPPAASTALERLRQLTRVWDELIRIPGLGWRVGLDALIGLVPGAGDLVGLAVSLWPVGVAARLGAGSAILSRMLVNVLVDAAVGAIPLAGDLFDVAWKANRRNLDLLERWAADPGRVSRSSRWLLVGLSAGVAGVVVAVGWLTVRLIVAVFGG